MELLRKIPLKAAEKLTKESDKRIFICKDEHFFKLLGFKWDADFYCLVLAFH